MAADEYGANSYWFNAETGKATWVPEPGSVPALGACGVGWSDQVNNPCFKKNERKNNHADYHYDDYQRDYFSCI